MRLSAPRLLLLPVALLACCAGCGGERDATAKQIDELRAEVSRLRANQAALTERLDAVDLQRGTFAKGGPAAEPVPAPQPASTRPGDRDRPELDVVRLSPSEGDGDADSGAPRPVIKAGGDGAGPRQTLNNRTIGAHPAPKKGIVASAPKKAANDAPPVAKP